MLLDLHLPDMPGEEVLSRLRAVPETRTTPVVVISAEDDPARRREAEACGIQRFVPKSARPAEIIEAIRQAFDAASLRVPTGELNRFVEALHFDERKIYYITQASVRPPTFVAFTNRGDPLPDLLRELDPRRRTCFRPLRAYTMIFCYNERERSISDSDGRRLEIWSGHLAPVHTRHGSAHGLGRYRRSLPRRSPQAPSAILRFTRLQVQSVRGLRRMVRLEFGVDGQQRAFVSRATPGAALDLTGRIQPIELDPDLDGELWARGVQKGIIRNRLKIEAIIDNARRIQALRRSHGGFAQWLDAHHPRAKAEWVKLFRKTFRFTGGEVVGEFLMSLGYLPGAHEEACPVHRRIKRLGPPWARSKKSRNAR